MCQIIILILPQLRPNSKVLIALAGIAENTSCVWKHRRRLLSHEAVFNAVGVAVVEAAALAQAGEELYKAAIGQAGLNLHRVCEGTVGTVPETPVVIFTEAFMPESIFSSLGRVTVTVYLVLPPEFSP